MHAATLKHVAKTVAHVDLNDHVVAVVFTIFDENGETRVGPFLELGRRLGLGRVLIQDGGGGDGVGVAVFDCFSVWACVQRTASSANTSSFR